MSPVVGTNVEQFQKCIDACLACMQVCEECFSSCLKEPDANAREKCIKTLRDCADICGMSAQYMSRESTHVKQICGLCAEICEACATECNMFKDAHCQKCTEVCRECAQECHNMVNMM